MKNAIRSIALVTVLLAVLSSVSHAAVRMQAPVSTVSMQTAMADAMLLAGLHADSQVLRVSGSSMHPFFGDGALLVIKPISELRLRAGMVVVYRNRFNETVAHRLVSQNANGWVAMGYNNSEVDSTPVNASNLIGVVYATIHSSGEMLASAAASSLPVALAAPAK